jgi:hypothetical protein
VKKLSISDASVDSDIEKNRVASNWSTLLPVGCPEIPKRIMARVMRHSCSISSHAQQRAAQSMPVSGAENGAPFFEVMGIPTGWPAFAGHDILSWGDHSLLVCKKQLVIKERR